jgi:hypothetical protein
MWIYLVAGIAIGIIIGATFERFAVGIIGLVQDVFQYKKTDEAVFYDIDSKKQTYDFYREYPEAKGEEEEKSAVDAVGFQFYPQSESEFDDEEDKHKNKVQMGF